MKPAAPLREFIEGVAARAEQMFMARGKLLPMYHAIDAEGGDLVFPAPPVDNKDQSNAIVRMLLAEAGATRVAFLGEAWMLAARDGEIDLDQVQRDGIEDNPARIEILMISVEDAKEGFVLASREITRRDGSVTLGDLEINRMGSAEGRMVGLLPVPAVRH